MTSDDSEDRALETATFRYRVLAEILETLEQGAGIGVRRAIADAAKRSYIDHRGRATRVTTRTLWRWLAAWRESGIKGLWPRAARKDRGSLRAFKREILDRAVELRREQPRRATETIVDILEREKTVEVGAIARSTLDRHLDRLGCSRRLLRTLGSKVRRQIRTDRPLELVVTDFHHGPYVVVDDDGTLKRALLCAFIDHFSRIVLEGRYYLREDFVALRFGFRLCVTKHGLMEKLYADNGAAFQAIRFKGACLQLGVRFPHSKPYDAESRGLIERFNGTLKGQFEEEVRARREPPTLTPSSTPSSRHGSESAITARSTPRSASRRSSASTATTSRGRSPTSRSWTSFSASATAARSTGSGAPSKSTGSTTSSIPRSAVAGSTCSTTRSIPRTS